MLHPPQRCALPPSHDFDRSLTPHGSRAACASSSASPSRRTSSTTARRSHSSSSRERRYMASAAHLSACRRRRLPPAIRPAHRNVRVCARRPITASRARTAACRIWTLRPSSSASGVRVAGTVLRAFLQTIYEAEGRFTVDAVLRSLEDVSIAGACVIECGEEHLGRRFRLCC